MKLVKTEVLLDRSKVLFLLHLGEEGRFSRTGEGSGHAEFRMRIEMRQYGVRDEAKMICGIGSCGRELCCAKYMNRFRTGLCQNG